MSTFNISNDILKVYTDKNPSIFDKACEIAINKILYNKKFGILYSDYSLDKKIVNDWKNDYPDRILYTVADRSKTLHIDDKIFFDRIMKNSIYTSESYNSFTEITDKNSLYFVKSRGSSGGLGVNIHSYDELQNMDISTCIIQKDVNIPDILDNRRYKIRQYVVLHNKNVYLYKTGFYIKSVIDFDDQNENNRRLKHVINQKPTTIFELNEKLHDYDTIYTNIVLAIDDFKSRYSTYIEKINQNEYAILGFDIVVDSDKQVYIIEINHRSNYSHPSNVRTTCDIPFIADTMCLLTNQSVENTNFQQIL